MRPVNLIPPEDRRGDRAPLRAGGLSYVVVGSFAAVLVAVLAMVLTTNGITESENEIAELEVARDAATQRATALAPYAEFAALQTQRELTIASLAQSRFDWERVLRELALVIPADISLASLEAATAGNLDSGGETGAAVTPAPTLLMSGCASSHDGVAAFVAALEDIDGVTRVGLTNSTAAGDEEDESSGDGAAGTCIRKDSASFSATAVFDAAAATITTDPAAAAAAAATPVETNSPQEQTDEAGNAANLVPGAAR